jgi:signal peptidase II
MKFKHVVFITVLVLVIDQALKLWVKTHMQLDETINLIGDWCKLHFVENPGAAWGLSLKGMWGKIILTSFRLVAVIAGYFLIKRFIKQQYTKGFIICASLIWAGAIGNLIDSLLYGLIFDKGMIFNATTGEYENYTGLAKYVKFGTGYSKPLLGHVVDMFYFPIFKIGKFTFFNAIFNIADAAISIGVITIILFQKKLYRRVQPAADNTIETRAMVNDELQVN